jgi:hypothetical protein
MPVGTVRTALLGAYLVLLGALLVALLALLWPDKAEGQELVTGVRLFGREVLACTIPYEVRLILIVVVTGALGSLVHAATSFASYVGNRTLTQSWVWWYLLRPMIGSALAVLFYFVSRGGLVSAGAKGDALSVFGIAAGAGVVGMFSKQAADKLKEVADNLFRVGTSQGDAERKDKLERQNPVPQIDSLAPQTLAANSAARTITVKGHGFVEACSVQVNASDRKPTSVAADQIVFDLTPTDVAQAGKLKIAVVNPAPGGGSSNTLDLTITS